MTSSLTVPPITIADDPDDRDRHRQPDARDRASRTRAAAALGRSFVGSRSARACPRDSVPHHAELTFPIAPDHTITRRSLLRAAAGGAGAAGDARAAGLGPARWRSPRACAPEQPPVPAPPAGTPSMPEIEHIVVLMMENHSFDNLLGMVPYQVPGPRGRSTG